MHRIRSSTSCSSWSVNMSIIARIFRDNGDKIGRGNVRLINGVDGATVRGFSFARENSLIRYSEEVENALNHEIPIVALESTIITHGMPYPDNLTTAIRVEEIIRAKGVVPATIAIHDGKIHVGMDRDRLEKVATSAIGRDAQELAMKCSRRDLSTVVCKKLIGGTTVGGTMAIARMAGIPIMATGGIGGVHRGAETTLDISSDLTELSRNRVAVVCAGVKAILDIPKTLEYLETQGVPVITIGDTDNFPAFYSRETSTKKPVKSPACMKNAEQAAELLRIQEILKLDAGILFAVPIPKSHALESNVVESVIQEALEIAENRGIRGKYVTPFLLQQLNQLTSGGFLKANQALVENNAHVAADIALELNRLRNQDKSSSGSYQKVQRSSGTKPPTVVIGGATLDTMLLVDHPGISLGGGTHRAKRRESHGGVGRNVAAAMVALGHSNTKLISVVGDDDAGRSIAKELGDAGETIEFLSDVITPRYTAILDNTGECHFGIGEMDTFESIDAKLVRKHCATIEGAGLVVIDGNLPLETMRACIDLAARNKIPVWYEPTDVSKATKIFETGSEWIDRNSGRFQTSTVQFISPNVNELVAIAKYLGIRSEPRDNFNFNDSNDYKENLSIEWISELTKRVAEKIPVVITTLGPRGLVVARKGSKLEPLFDPSRKFEKVSKSSSDEIQSRYYPAPVVEKRNENEKFSVSGCGDCLAAALITGSYHGLDEVDCIKLALEAASISLRSQDPVPRALKTLRIVLASQKTS